MLQEDKTSEDVQKNGGEMDEEIYPLSGVRFRLSRQEDYHYIR